MKKFRESILFAATSGQLTANWREHSPNVEPASGFLKQIISMRNWNLDGSGLNIDKLPELPPTWEWTTLKLISEIRGGITKGKIDYSASILAGC